MKSIFTLSLWAMSVVAVFAQQPCPPDTPYKETAYNILKNLDKSQVPTGILYENVFPLANLYEYTGNPSTDTTHTDHFLQAYAELYLSKFNNTGTKHYFDLYDEIQAFNPDKKYHHPIGIIDYDFNTIHPDAVTNNLLSVNNQQLYDVPNRPSSPYVSEKAVIASILLTEEYPCLYAGQHYFTFNSNFVLTNSGFSLSQVTHLEAIFNGTNIYNADVSGLDNFTLPLTVSNNSQSSILVLILTVNGIQKHYIINACQVAIDPITACRGQDQIEVVGYPFDGGYGEGLYSERGIATIYWSNASCADKKLRKPIIFVDGFDASNSQHHETIWRDYINFPYRENGINTFLGDTLLAKGYDVIILDQKVADGDKKYNRGGAGLIENNGLVLAVLLETLYAQHSSTMTEDFVVVGASMGGKVARYGLAWMEKHNKPHHTRLFISFDSPQNGAQIPLGLQQTVDKFIQFGGLAVFPSVRNKLHQSNAAKQMLLHHSSTASESVQAHPFRDIWLNNVAAVGNYPSQCRIVSIVNGNRVGLLKNIVPNPPNNFDAVPIDEKDLEADFGIKRRRLSFCNANLCYKLHAQIYAQTASNRNVTNVFTVNSTNLLNIVAGFQFPFFAKSLYAVNENGTSLDVAPGARLRLNPLELAEGNITKVLSAILVGPIKISTNNLRHSNFIPTTSSVAYTFPNSETPSFYKNFTGVNLSRCAGTTPFDTVYAPPYDMPHVAINDFIANAFRAEVFTIKAKPVCSFECPEYIVSSDFLSGVNTVNYKAQKAITLTPGFFVQSVEGYYFKAQIGCTNLLMPQVKKEPLPVSLLTSCNFDWNQTKNEVLCGNGFTTFRAFVKNFDLDTYAEFSTNGSTWFRANLGDDGYEIIVNANPGQAQQFFARPHNNPTNVIQGWLAHCN